MGKKEMADAITNGRNYVFKLPLETLRAVNVAPSDNSDRRNGMPDEQKLTEKYIESKSIKL